MAGIVALGAAWPLPEPVELPPRGVEILDRHGRLLYQVVDPERGAARPVLLEAIAPALRQATVAVEDASFDTNPGVDLLGTARALSENIAVGRVVGGGSTITQQLARLRHVSADERSSQSVARKLTEVWLALRLTRELGKSTVLEQYLNSAPYGNLAVGAESAAWTYFGKPARELSVAEAALLAGLPQSPTDYDPFTHLDAARARQHIVLDLMQRRGVLTPAQVQSAKTEPLRLNDRPFPLEAAHFVDYARSIVPPSAMRIWTTLDRDVQAMAERAAQRQVARLAGHDVSDAAVIVLDPNTGEVLALVGGVDYFDHDLPGAQVNVAVSLRQPGSAFKPITYAAALESGRFSQASILLDKRTVFRTRRGEGYAPENYDRQFHGPVPLRMALASSLNVPAVHVLSEIGLEAVYRLADDLGLRLGDPDRLDLSLTLGGAEVALLDLTAAYGALAAGGVMHPPVVIKHMEDAEGRRVTPSAASLAPAKRVMSAETAWLISDMLSDDAARGPGFGRDGVLHWSRRQVAVKTGTTSDFRDNWTIGYTPDVVVGVWVGNPDNRPMRQVSGVTGAAPLWRDVLGELIDTSPPRVFERPPDLVQVELCAESEALASSACAARRLEWLVPSRQLPRTVVLSSAVRIVFPDPGMVIVLDPSLPPSAQQLVVDIDSSEAVDLLVDGVVVGSLTHGGAISWAPTPGRHVLVARTAEAECDPVPIGVVRS
jgi:penicillin-binding protein 1C